ncbi:nitrate reductase [Marinoscillum furvescens]|uniref:Ferredoxin-nitrate reductase n=1 Tax=Marinoscillum furvescens DSM 4134 TaxID=1122208 RepID=A0A3D9LIZ1_MARFU|nr:nitrate reductase [Marinoscillum furvescens]REE05626.1 ferredoxin-nitrate reductase [Marinoscillum furvescens DSM 4134]
MPQKWGPPIKTTCSYCGVGCGIEIRKSDKGKLTLKGDEQYPVNKGMLCSKGMNLHYTAMDQSDRLTAPQMRWSRRHPLEEVSWDTAMQRAAAVFKTFIEQHGPDSVGFYVSGQLLTEEYYLANKLVKGFLGTNNIDTNSRLCMSSAVVGYKETVGDDAVPISYEDIELSDTILIAGANPAWCHPILFRRIEKHKAENPEVKIIVVDPRVTDSCALADLHLQVQPGTDKYLFHAVGQYLIDQGMIDEAFIRQHTNGYEQYAKEVKGKSLKEYAAICQVPEDDIIQAARLIGQSKGFITMWAMGLNQSTTGVNQNLALINLNLITGKIGKPGCGPFSLTGQPNAMGGREVGGLANLLAAHKNLANPEHRKEVADFWGVESIQEKPGLTATEMFDALKSGKMKAIWVICTNPSVSMPNARLVDEALKAARFVVVQDISKNSDTAQYADLLLPAAGWLEKEGTMTNSERRISYLPKLLDPPGNALPDAEILMRFADKMGYHGFDFESMSEVYDEYALLTKDTPIDITGLSYERLKIERSMQWPVPAPNHGGTPRLFEDGKFLTPDQKANIHTTGPENEAEPISPDFPLILTTGRIRDQWHTMTRTGKVSKLKKHIDRPFLEIHPEDAAQRGITEGMPVLISNARGEVQVAARLSTAIKKGVVFLPMHWGKKLNGDLNRANNLTSERYDPKSKQPGFKFSAVEVVPYTAPPRKVVVIGAGAAAYRFVNTYREFNKSDEIHVFSKEKWPFYNRVLLPDYVNETKEWKDLVKYTETELAQLDLVLHPANPIEKIDREHKTVTDHHGASHPYDMLIMATGSRAFVPPNAPMHLPGVFTMRDRENADDLKKQLCPGSHVLVIGGGLLGLELAAALTEMQVSATIVQLGSRLMERQLDPVASAMLREYVEDLGVRVYTNDEVVSITENEQKLLDISLKSSNSLTVNAVVYAIGTRPNIQLAADAGLEHGRGVKVNDYLQTNDPDIFALGEIAEHNQRMNGITAAAEAQADICARYLAGDPSQYYTGTSPMNILKFPSLDLCSVGIPEIPVNGKNYSEITFLDREALFYKKCIIHNDKLVGTILLGDKAEFAEYKELIESGTELSEKRMQLLRSGNAPEPVKGKLVCSCNNVGEVNLQEAISKGCQDLNSLCQTTGAGLGCGSCKSEVKRLIDRSVEPVS